MLPVGIYMCNSLCFLMTACTSCKLHYVQHQFKIVVWWNMLMLSLAMQTRSLIHSNTPPRAWLFIHSIVCVSSDPIQFPFHIHIVVVVFRSGQATQIPFILPEWLWLNCKICVLGVVSHFAPAVTMPVPVSSSQLTGLTIQNIIHPRAREIYSRGVFIRIYSPANGPARRRCRIYKHRSQQYHHNPLMK